MEKRKFQPAHIYILAILIGSLIFLSGFLIVKQVNYSRNTVVLSNNFNSFYSLFEISISSILLNEDICSVNFSKKAEESFYFQTKMISDLETALGKTDPKVIMQKQIYTLAEAEYFNIKMMQKKKCGTNETIILFFYSNELDKIDESERVGRILDALSSKHMGLVVYSFDDSLNLTLVNKLESVYGVGTFPSIVVNGVLAPSPKTINDIHI